jgi:hypothetical protein
MLQNKKLQLIGHGDALHRCTGINLPVSAKRATSSEESEASPFP